MEKRVAIFYTILITLCVSFTLIAGGPRGDLPARDLQISALPPLCESMGQHEVGRCKYLPQVSKYRCDDIKPPLQYWGGLKPYLPMAVCLRYRGPAAASAVRHTGCMVPVREQYLVLAPAGKKGELRIIETPEDFRRFFAPIEGAREAISFISALTGAYPKYEFPERFFIRDMNEDGRYVSGRLEPTAVEEKKDGWHVRLFDHTSCGCHRPELYEIDYVVTRDGYVKEEGRKAVWQADRTYQICID